MGFGGSYRVRERGLFDPLSSAPFRISRSKIDLFVECPRCFYLDQRLGVPRVDFPTFTLNNAVDELLKKEFDIHRAAGSVHPLLKNYDVDAKPLNHKDIPLWREARRAGIEFLHAPTNLSVRGGIDDVWENPKGELIIVDYKATSKKKEIELYDNYKRQVEVYQWLFRRNGFIVSPTAYFVYVNGRTDAKAFDGKLEFDVQLMSHKGDDSWIEPTLFKIKDCLMQEAIPAAGQCDWCPYREAAGKELYKRTPKSLQKEKQATLGL